MMYSYKKSQHLVKMTCPTCNEILKFKIPDKILDGVERFPVTFRYVHGQPPHSVTLYVDANFDVRGREFGDSISLSHDIIQSIFAGCDISKPNKSRELITTLFKVFTTSINALVPQSEVILYDVGTRIGENLYPVFKSNDLDSLLIEVSRFWKIHGLGEIDELEIAKDKISFKVFECYECSHMPNIGHPVCKLDEGFLTEVFNQKFQHKFTVNEVECYANGFDHCKFEVKKN